MAATSLPVSPDSPDNTNWQALVRDQRYRLFAAGNRKAAIAEGLPLPSSKAGLEDARPDPGTFDTRYGLTAEAQKRLVLLTHVYRTFEVSRREVARPHRPWRWAASHRVQPMAELKSYLDEQEGSLVLFLTRSKQVSATNAAGARERLEDSALQIGSSLGLQDDNLEALRVAGLVHAVSKVAPTLPAGGSSSEAIDDRIYESDRCQSPGCPTAPAAHLEGAPYCKEHFISKCYEQLDVCSEHLVQHRDSLEETGRMRMFLRACIEQATVLTRNPFHQDALERARLLDILYTASDLCRRMRRSLRRAEAIPVRLVCETPGRPWHEEMRTVLISQHGAMLECEHLVKPEDWLAIVREDTGRRVRARMAWRGPAKAGYFAVGLEFVDSENFWGLSWAHA